MLDLELAIFHHLLVFALVAVLVAEFAIVRSGIGLEGVRRTVIFDSWYGILAGTILVVGFSRAFLAAKGWDYYSHNLFFWAKIGTFVTIGLLSIPPTIAYRKWQRAEVTPSNENIAHVRKFLLIQIILVAPLLGFAAAMARGYGSF